MFCSGGDSYSSSNGVKAVIFRISSTDSSLMLDPASLYFKATLTNDSGALLTFKAPFRSCIHRCTIRLGSTTIEDTHSFGRLFNLLHTPSDPDTQKMSSIGTGDGANGVLAAGGSTTERR